MAATRGGSILILAAWTTNQGHSRQFAGEGMLRIVITDDSGKNVLPSELATVAELREAVQQAHRLVGECERQALLKEPKGPARKPGTPYLS